MAPENNNPRVSLRRPNTSDSSDLTPSSASTSIRGSPRLQIKPCDDPTLSFRKSPRLLLHASSDSENSNLMLLDSHAAEKQQSSKKLKASSSSAPIIANANGSRISPRLTKPISFNLTLSDPTSLRKSPRLPTKPCDGPIFSIPNSLLKSPKLFYAAVSDLGNSYLMAEKQSSKKLKTSSASNLTTLAQANESRASSPRRKKPNSFNLTLSDSNSLRRSPRLPNMPCDNTTLSKPNSLRKSPRLFPAVSNSGNANLTAHDPCNEEQPARKTPNSFDLTLSDSSSLRRSPRLPSKACDNPTLSNPNSFRKSPRLFPAISNSENANLSAHDPCTEKQPAKKVKAFSATNNKKQERGVSFFIGDPVPEEDARTRWPWRFQQEGGQSKQGSLDSDDEDKLILNVKCHYSHAEIEKCIFNLGDCAYVKFQMYVKGKELWGHIDGTDPKPLDKDKIALWEGTEGGRNYVGRILEFFKTMDDKDYFRVQWFFRAEDTVMKEEAASHDKKRLFYSKLMNDNLLDCIVSKVKIVQIAPKVNLKSKPIPSCDFYYDMEYSVDYSTFSTMLADNSADSRILSSSPFMKTVHLNNSQPKLEGLSSHKHYKTELALLDIYSGCGGMSTGLCLGAKLSGLDLVTRWALDMNKSACETLKLNHPETQIRNESAEDFLDLLKEWDKLCKRYAVKSIDKSPKSNFRDLRQSQKNLDSKADEKTPSDEYEVASLLDICYGDPDDSGKRGLRFQVRWAGYGPSGDTWEPIEELSKCQDRIQDFVLKGIKAKILPRPGDVDVICGGPPCQGISGYNRFRNVESPLDDERNRQIVIFMDIVNFLKPKYILMENVVDILRFAKGVLGRYALSRLVQMNYQARLGIMAAGCYGLAQFRLRAFLWGAHPCEVLPQFPLPTHDVVLKYGAPSEFERNVVAYDEGQIRDLEKALVLRDAISDLPPVTSHETREEMSYKNPPETDFQKYIRATKEEMMGFASHDGRTTKKSILYDHRPHPLNEDDYLRVCQIPRQKGANFRDLPGVIVGSDNVVRRDPSAKPILLPSGKALVPDWALHFGEGKSLRPYGRLWWDDVVPTVLCRPDTHSQVTLHPEQDRVLTLRESARLQGFPDYYKFCGDIKKRYRQVGNAVAVPVARALGYAMGMAMRKMSSDEPLMTLPHKFSHSTTIELLHSLSPSNDSAVVE